ncbi:MAG: thiamine biosynthesis protein ApbE [Rhodobacterales bacterium]|nr:MAG: thiamine biosynthesis protein ApbE [Rhodobacterales bacterium]
MSDRITFTRRSFMIAPLAIAACNSGADIVKIIGETMGTTYTVVAVDHSRSVGEAAVKRETEAALALVNRQMSNWDPASEISRFNAGGTGAVAVSAELDEVMQAARLVNAASAGRFDTTIGPLIELWGFGARGTRQVPGDDQIAEALARSGHATLEVGPGALRKTRPETLVYLAAIGKGYGADQVGRALKSLGLTDYMVEIGGDLVTAGRNPDGLPWQIGIEKPASLSGGIMDVVGVSGYGLASSGDYRNYFERDGARFSHLIDPVTGRPVTHRTASATVLADNAMLADAWSTAMLILGREKGLEIAEAQGLAVRFIERDMAANELRFTTSESAAFATLTS